MAKHNDQCYCETCRHQKGSECIQLNCVCCLKADRIRLNHPVFEGEDESQNEEEEKTSEDRYRQQRGADMMGGIGFIVP